MERALLPPALRLARGRGLRPALLVAGVVGAAGAGIPVVVPDEVGPRVVLVTTQAGKSFLAKLEMLKMALRRVPVPVQ